VRTICNDLRDPKPSSLMSIWSRRYPC
jgi:hypothetical protein